MYDRLGITKVANREGLIGWIFVCMGDRLKVSVCMCLVVVDGIEGEKQTDMGED